MKIEAEFDLQTGTAIEADFEVQACIPISQANHNDLQGRSSDDAHPISAITGLQDALDELETAIEDETEAREGADTTLQQNIDTKVAKNADITAGTHTKITYDAKGLVTGGANLSESDIPALHLAKITDVTATATELNYVDGVTSNIQTQLDSKQPNLPTQSGQSGKYLKTDGTALSWASVDALPSQSGQSGKFLSTNGTIASWEDVNAMEIIDHTGDV